MENTSQTARPEDQSKCQVKSLSMSSRNLPIVAIPVVNFQSRYSSNQFLDDLRNSNRQGIKQNQRYNKTYSETLLFKSQDYVSVSANKGLPTSN